MGKKIAVLMEMRLMGKLQREENIRSLEFLTLYSVYIKQERIRFQFQGSSLIIDHQVPIGFPV